MSVRWRVESLAAWPHPDTPARKSSGVFRASWDNTMRLLRDEADRLGAAEPIVLQLVCDAADVRQDGMLRARAMVRHPGVIVTLATDHGPLVFATDKYEQRYSSDLPDWQANVRAIALGLDALRAVDRHGVTRTGEQYAGFRAIEAGSSLPFRDVTEAFAWLVTTTGMPTSSTSGELIRRARALHHPDRTGGDRSGWDRVDAAEQLLSTTTRR